MSEGDDDNDDDEKAAAAPAGVEKEVVVGSVDCGGGWDLNVGAAV